MCLNVIFLACPVILVLRYMLPYIVPLLFASRLLAIFVINMSVHAQERMYTPVIISCSRLLLQSYSAK